MKPGPKPGYKQSPEHIEKRKRFGENHHQWKGDNAPKKQGWRRAERMFKDIGLCKRCGIKKAERHHKDGNTLNNDPSNVEFICRRCHMKEDGRLERFIKLAKLNKPRAVFSRWHKTSL